MCSTKVISFQIIIQLVLISVCTEVGINEQFKKQIFLANNVAKTKNVNLRKYKLNTKKNVFVPTPSGNILNGKE